MSNSSKKCSTTPSAESPNTVVAINPGAVFSAAMGRAHENGQKALLLMPAVAGKVLSGSAREALLVLMCLGEAADAALLGNATACEARLREMFRHADAATAKILEVLDHNGMSLEDLMRAFTSPVDCRPPA